MRQSLLVLLSVAVSAFSSLRAADVVDDVIRMQRSGTNTEVLMAYVDANPPANSPTSDDIQRMEDAHVPATVIVEMLDRSNPNTPAPVADNAPVTDTTVAADTEEVAYAPPTDNADLTTFYEGLAPYGEWTETADVGYVWTPTNVSAEWRPYVDNGHWVYTDTGWYWDSGYAWGWAPFHYGRWSYVDARWRWAPDVTWGPAWVTWRDSDAYFGWAPLPWGARFEPGIGFSYRDRHFGFDAAFDFGLGASAFAFVPGNAFLSLNIGTVAFGRDRSERIFHETRVVNNTYNIQGNTVINNGIPRERVASVTGRQIQPVHVADATVRAGQPIPRSSREGNEIRAFRPTIQNRASVDPKVAIQRGREAAKEHRAVAQQQRTQNPRTPQTQTNGVARQRLTEAQARERLAQERTRLRNNPPSTAQNRVQERKPSDTSFDRRTQENERAIEQRQQLQQREQAQQQRQTEQRQELQQREQALQQRHAEDRTEQRQAVEQRQELQQREQAQQRQAIEQRQAEQRQQVEQRQQERRIEQPRPEPRQSIQPRVEPRAEPRVEPRAEPRVEPRAEPRAEPHQAAPRAFEGQERRRE